MQVDPSLVVVAATVIATAGAALYRLGSLEARVRELEAFRIRGGERLGRLEENARHVQAFAHLAGRPQPGGRRPGGGRRRPGGGGNRSR